MYLRLREVSGAYSISQKSLVAGHPGSCALVGAPQPLASPNKRFVSGHLTAFIAANKKNVGDLNDWMPVGESWWCCNFAVASHEYNIKVMSETSIVFTLGENRQPTTTRVGRVVDRASVGGPAENILNFVPTRNCGQGNTGQGRKERQQCDILDSVSPLPSKQPELVDLLAY